ncbi:MAG TPA: hypothetical protein VFV70_01870 [Hyphomonadaceae bacterium]|nr:hypothetical protein [Hyphomonadaceae bacterium]
MKVLGPLSCSLLLFGACASEPTPFAFSRAGDDGLTLKISEAILDQLRSSGEFVESSQGEIRLHIDGHAAWRRVGDRVDASIRLNLYREGDWAAGATIQCYEDEVEVCGRAALEFARRYIGQERRKS